MFTTISRAALAGVTLGLAMAVAVPASAQPAGERSMGKPTVMPGDYFSTTYRVNAPRRDGGWAREKFVKQTWTVTRSGRSVAWAPGRALPPGAYRMTMTARPTSDAAPRRTTFAALWSNVDTRDWQARLVNKRTSVRSHVERKQVWDDTVISGGVVLPDPDNTGSGPRAFPVWTDGVTYYYFDYDGPDTVVYVQLADTLVDDSRQRYVLRPDGDHYLNIFKGGYVTRDVTVIDGYDTAATLQMTYPRMGLQYRAPVAFSTGVAPNASSAWIHAIPRNTVVTRLGAAPKRLDRRSVTFTVKARNSRFVTRREARAIRVGMTQQQVARIFGSSGQEDITSPAYEGRRYEADYRSLDIYIGYLNGRVNSIQR